MRVYEPNEGPRGPGLKNVNLDVLRRILGGGLMLVALTFLVVVVFLFMTIRVGPVSGEQVGILLNRLNGNITVIEQSGVRIYNGLTSDFYVLDKTLQTLRMEGGRSGDSLKVKTIDGSDVYVDVRVQYRITPEMADTVITTSGPGAAFKEKWMRDYCRSVCRNYLGELTTEEFYDAGAREGKILAAKAQINEWLQEYGIEVDSIVIPQRPVFYQEYEEMIKKKKLADQEVLEEQSKAQAAEERQKTLIVSATNKKNVAVERFRGEMEQLIIQAKADAEKTRKEADAYFERVTIGADATFYRNQKEAEGILERKKAEAQGISAMRQALEGPGGRNMVKLEYARKLKEIVISGQPFTIDSRTERFQHTTGAATQGRTVGSE